VVTTTLPAGRDFAELVHALPRLGAVLAPLDPRAPARPVDVEAPVTGAEADVELRDTVDPGAVHSIIHTSGTTGRPKAVELTYANHHASALASAENLGNEPGDRWLSPLPVFHVGGLAVLLRCAIYGTTAVLHDGFDVDGARRSFESGEATLASLVPTMLSRLRDAGMTDAPELRALLLGGGPIPGDLLEWARSIGLPVVPVYGMTETSSQVVAGIPGRPLPGVEIEVAGDGEILVRGPMVSRGAMAADGWLHTGDSGHLDGEGLLHVTGRAKDLIVTGGENVAPVEVEDALLSHPAVADVAVLGLPDPEWGEAVTAFVVLSGQATSEELIEHARERLAPFKVPKRVEQVAGLPRNPAGKLLRGEIVP
jgi:O-succinylbenzoic acid--CoA ligase